MPASKSYSIPGEPQRSATRGAQGDDRIFQDALLDARCYSADALLAFADALAFDAADPDPDFPGEVGRHLARERLRAVRDELTRRERLHRLNAGVPSPNDRRYQQWRVVAGLLRERIDLVEVFTACGHQLHDVGPHEAHAPCLVCGGVDRLVIRRGPPSRCWCRRCSWSADVVALTMSIRQLDFRAAVAWLSDLAGIPAPEPHPLPQARNGATSRPALVIGGDTGRRS